MVGVIGHIDHGKTALVRALTGIDTDRLPDEKRRGISIALGFAHFTPGPDLCIELIDMPGHERFVRAMIAGATGIDAVLLVVAANEGIQPQTIEHADIAALLGVTRAVIAITKADLVAAPAIEAVSRAASRLAESRGLDAGPPTVTGLCAPDSLARLEQAIGALAGHAPPRPAGAIPFLPIDRAFTLPGHGTIVTGTLRGGPLAASDMLELLPSSRRLRIRAIQTHGERVSRVTPGNRVALNLRDIAPAEIARGAALAPAGLLSATPWVAVVLRSVPAAPPLETGTMLRAHIGTAECDARLRLLDRDRLDPGESAFAQLHLAHPLPAPPREPVLLRLASPPRTVAGGPILDSEPRRLRRHTDATRTRCAILARFDAGDTLGLYLSEAGADGTTLTTLARQSGLAPQTAAHHLDATQVITRANGRIVRRPLLVQLMTEMETTLRRAPDGLDRASLRAAFPNLPDAEREAVLDALQEFGRIRRQASRCVATTTEAERARQRRAAEMTAWVEAKLAHAGLAPPEPAALLENAETRAALADLLRAGLILRLRDRVQARDLLFHRSAIDDARRRLEPSLREPPGLLVSDAGRLLGISRKYSVPLLEYLDAIRFTCRVGDRRRLATEADPRRL